MATLYVDKYTKYRNGSKRKQASKLTFQNNLIEVDVLKKSVYWQDITSTIKSIFIGL